jgi:hypothetical protein
MMFNTDDVLLKAEPKPDDRYDVFNAALSA